MSLGDNERRLRTNPVLELKDWLRRLTSDRELWLKKGSQFEALLQALCKEGLRLPGHFVHELNAGGFEVPRGLRAAEPLRPGVVGLLWDRKADQGVVTPLRIEVVDAGGDWSIADHLPFDADGLQRLFIALARELGLPAAVPERLAFTIDDGLGVPAQGRSMNIAALLGVIRELASPAELLDAACAVLEPDGDDGKLRASDGVEAKLDAFRREIETGTLLVRHSDCPTAGKYDAYFEEVWTVRSLKELGERLQSAGLLAGLFERVILDEADFRRINGRLEELLEREHDYDAVMDLARRVLQCEASPAVSEERLAVVRRALLNSQRHRGSLDILSRERSQLEKLRKAGRFTCFEEIADEAVHVAASCYDLHLFDEMVNILELWKERVEQEPRLLSPELRYMLFNTLARGLMAKGESGWSMLFERSLELQRELAPEQVHRTRNYLIHGLLRAGELERAGQEIEAAFQDEFLDGYSRNFLCFYRADLARRSGEQWEDPELEDRGLKISGPGHPTGFYFQATARQKGRSTSDRQARLLVSRRLFLKDVDPLLEENKNSILYLLATAVELASAAYAEDRRRWRRECEFLEDFLEPRTHREMARYYKDVTAQLGEEPSVAVAEKLLTQVPYF